MEPSYQPILDAARRAGGSEEKEGWANCDEPFRVWPRESRAWNRDVRVRSEGILLGWGF